MSKSRASITDYFCTSIRQQFLKMTQGKRPVNRRNSRSRRRVGGIAVLVFALGCSAVRALPKTAQTPSEAKLQQTSEARDGQHDFDFNLGTWHTHIKRVLDPFSGSANSIELNGTVTVRKVWDGRAQLEEIEADGPNGHWEGLSLFLYNPQSRQWNQSFINSKKAALTSPLIGAFKDGRSELFAQDTFHDKLILVRAVWSNITPDAHRYEESYSNNGGKTWARSFVADLARERVPVPETAAAPPSADATQASAADGQHDFDFDFGTWKTHSSRLLHPLTGIDDVGRHGRCLRR